MYIYIYIYIYRERERERERERGENSQICKICGKLTVFQKYLAIYHFFNTRVPQNRVLNSTRVQ